MRRALVPLACTLAFAGCIAAATPTASDTPVTLPLYRLDREPTFDDWRALPPVLVTARGGAMVDPGLAYRMDQSLTHQANADCHHGPGSGAAIDVGVSGFWSPEAVWLRVSWDDRTMNDRFRAWRREAGGWAATGEREDGVSIAWGTEGLPCHQACHLADWVFSQGVWVPRYVMVSATDPVPFWLWRAHRGGIYRQAESGYLGPDKVNYDPKGPRFSLNSAKAPEDPLAAFDEKDRPASVTAGAQWLPGVVPLGPGSAGAVAAASRRDGRRWEVIMRRALTVAEGEGISLDPSKGAVIGIALFDDSLTDHHIVGEPLRLSFLPAAEEVSP